MKIQFDSFNLTSGNDIMLGKAGVYELEHYSSFYGDKEGEIYSLTGGFGIEYDERGAYRFFEDAEVILLDNGFQIESDDGDEILRVTFKREMEEIKLPSCVSSFELVWFDGILRFPDAVAMDSIHLDRVRFLLDLPNQLNIRGNATIMCCPTLEEIPAGWSVGGKAYFSGNRNLKSVKAKKFTDLSLSGCDSLKSLPKGLKVKGNLDLAMCKSLTRLPHNLSVGGDLDLMGSGVREIPPTAKIGGRIIKTF